MVSSIQTQRRQWLILVCAGIGTFIASLNTSITNTVLPTIEQSLKISLSQSEWIVLIYLLILTASLVPIGRLSDLWGHRLLFLLGFALFTGGALICGLSESFLSLLAGRALFSIGGAMILSVSPALLTITFPPEKRGMVLGLQALMTYMGLSLGPVIGGFLTQVWGWQSTFLITAPFGIGGLLLGIWVIPKIMLESHKSLDLRGIISFVVAMAAITLLLNSDAIAYYRSFALLLLTIVFVGASWIFIHVEQNQAMPMIDLQLFRIRNFGFGALGAALNYLCFFLTLFLIPFYLDRILHYSALETGIYLTITPIIMAVCAPITGALSDRIGTRVFSMLGMVFSTMSLVLFGMMVHAGVLAHWFLILGLALTGLGTGTFAAPNNSAILGAAPRSHQGVASGVLATFRYMGMIAGTTVGGSVFDLLTVYFGYHGNNTRLAFLNAFTIVMWIGVTFGILGFACTFAMAKKVKTITHET